MTSATPRTDALARNTNDMAYIVSVVVPVGLARQLETELIESRAENERLQREIHRLTKTKNDQNPA